MAAALSSASVDVAVVNELAQAFHVHAETFDALYHKDVPVDAE